MIFSLLALIFAVYIIATSLMKLSKSWFVVSELQNELLIAEKQRSIQDKELLELEAKALRAQMNPHFIFNCLNSIKSLIQNEDKHKAIDYLTTFSKLIRTLFQNSDKRQISLFDEIETCRLYMQLEAMRLNGKLCYNINIVPDIDLKSVMVPALIIQPFIENAIWHGIVPRDGGTINISITQHKDVIVCEVDDDGIGRELSKLNKPVTSVIHKSQGLRLSQARIDLEKELNETHASIKIIDKYEGDKASGTVVVLTFNLN
jgi:sensor histidine kinase YesM